MIAPPPETLNKLFTLPLWKKLDLIHTVHCTVHCTLCTAGSFNHNNSVKFGNITN